MSQAEPSCLGRAEELIARRLQPGLSRKEATKRGLIASLGTARDYKYCLAGYFEWLEFCGIGTDEQDHKQHIVDYLEVLAETVSQRTLNQHKQALELVFQLKCSCNVWAIKPTNDTSRSYTWTEVKEITQHQTQKNAFATLLAYACGLRAHELATLKPAAEQPRSERKKWRTDLFTGMPPSELYTVVGKGGLIRHVAIPIQLALELEKLRCAPRLVTDRGIRYLQHYDIGFGQSFSQSFSSASSRALGVSHGAHGVRHSYVKRRINCLCDLGFSLGEAQLIVSQEVGHFRPSITFYYMR